MADLLQNLRMNGWMVAVHNDYRLSGEFRTFWLFTHAATGRFVKGEAPNDIGALQQCHDAAFKDAKESGS